MASSGNCGSVSFLMTYIHHSNAQMVFAWASANILLHETIWAVTDVYYWCCTLKCLSSIVNHCLQLSCFPVHSAFIPHTFHCLSAIIMLSRTFRFHSAYIPLKLLWPKTCIKNGFTKAANFNWQKDGIENKLFHFNFIFATCNFIIFKIVVFYTYRPVCTECVMCIAGH